MCLGHRPRVVTDVLAARLWHRVHSKCWDLVGPMLNFSRHTAVVGQPWEISKHRSNNHTEEAVAPGFVSEEYLLVRKFTLWYFAVHRHETCFASATLCQVVDSICRAATVPPGLVDVPSFERVVKRNLNVEIGLINLGSFSCTVLTWYSARVCYCKANICTSQ